MSALSLAAPPQMLHHTAYVTHDVAATCDFYTRVLRMKLVSSVIDDAIPSTGDPFPYIHIFFELADGSTIAFFESLDLPPLEPVSHPAYDIFNHLALNAGSVAAVQEWAKHLTAEGVEFIKQGHDRVLANVVEHLAQIGSRFPQKGRNQGIQPY